MEFTYGKTARLNGEEVDYVGWKAFDGPYMQSEARSRKLTLTHGELHHEIDFSDLR